MRINFLLSLLFFMNVKGYSDLNDPEEEVIQVFHVCQGGTVYIPWPVDFIRRSRRERPNITLTLQGKDSRRQRPIITYIGKSKKVIYEDERFKHRLIFSKEYSGIFLKDLTLSEQGVYTTQAKLGDMTWTTRSEVVLHMRPFIKDNRLTMSVIDGGNHPKDRKDCVMVECGRVDNEGYPPVFVVWKHNGTVLLREPVREAMWWSTYQVCPPFHGQLVCSIGGFTSTCNFDQSASINLDLPGTGVVTGSASVTSDTVLMIVIPVLAIGVPLLILGLWMCVHVCKTPRRRGQHGKHNNTNNSNNTNAIGAAPGSPSGNNSTADHNHVSHPSNFIAMDHANLPPFISFSSQHDLPPPILEDLNEEERESIATIETSNRLIGLHSPPKQYRDPEETEKKDSSIFKDQMEEEENDDDDDDEEEEEEDDGEEEDSDEDSDDEDDDDDEEEEEEEEEEDRDVDQETKEKQPLMEDSIHPIVL